MGVGKEKSSIYWLIPQNAAMVWDGPGHSQEPRTSSGSPPWIAEPQVLGSSYTAFPGVLVVSWIGNGAART